MDEHRKFLLQILEIVDHDPQKEAFADNFIILIFEESAYTLIQSLPDSKRDKVAQKWDANAGNPAALLSLLKHYFSEAQIRKVTEETAKKALLEFLQSLDSILTESQRKKLEKLSEEFRPLN